MDLWLPPKPAIIRPAPESKHASFLPGMFPAGVIAAAAAAAIPASISYVTTLVNATDGTSATFTDASVGAAAAGRKVIVGALVRGVATNLTATYEGTAMTQLAFVDGTNVSIAIFAIDEALVTAADIVITGAGGGFTACEIWIWNGFHCSATARAIGSDIVGADIGDDYQWTSDSMACPSGSVVAAVSAYDDALVSSADMTWTALTERDNRLLEDNRTTTSAADATLAAASPALVITARSLIVVGSTGGGLLAVCL